MIGNNVRVIRAGDLKAVQGELRQMNSEGATVYRSDGMPEQRGALFLPMHTIVEIVDLGRSYR
jgi:nitrogen regulatory protein PII